MFDFLFGFLKKKKPALQDPLGAYDAVIDSLERQAAEVRKSAATLLSLRGTLKRDCDRYRQRLDELGRRVIEASATGDAKVEDVLRRDRDEASNLKLQTEAALDGATRDAELLLSVASELTQRLTALKAERMSAQARFAAGQTLSQTLGAKADEFDRVVKLDAARDEVEKAHALADLYREEAAGRSTR